MSHASTLRCVTKTEGSILYDENSRNGTVLNGTRVEDRAVVSRGDRITIGQSVFKVSEA